MAASSTRTLPILDTTSQTEAPLRSPQLPLCSESVASKAKDEDRTSLSMQGCRHHHHKRVSRYAHDSPGASCQCNGKWQALSSEETSPRLYHCKPLPLSASSTAASFVVQPLLGLKLGDTGSAHRRRRRWTLSSKAACPQRRVAITPSAVYKPTSRMMPDTLGLPSPAMIVLRRASMARGSPPKKKISLTVFPEPHFERSRAQMLASFLRAITGVPDEDKEPLWPRAYDGGGSMASLGVHVAQLSHRGRSNTVCTKVADVQPTMVSPTGTHGDGETASRRCSTKYIMGNQVLEVIWDENVSSGTASASSYENEEVRSIGSQRRHSVAMESLETQLKKAAAQSRLHLQVTTKQARKSSFNEEDERQRQSSLYSSLVFKLSRLAVLQNVPRSRKLNGRKRKGMTNKLGRQLIPDLTPPVGVGDLETSQPSSKSSIDFFPPPSSPIRARSTRIDPRMQAESASM